MTALHKTQFRSSVSDSFEGEAKQRALKSLGQNFLIDDNIARKIISELSLSKGETVLEIGPGQGALTRLLVVKAGRVIAVEKDHRLSSVLKKEFGGIPEFELIIGDFLDYEFDSGKDLVKVVGNIPYNLTTEIVSRLVDFRSNLEMAVLMVQKEVADRLSAQPSTKEYGAISVRLQLTSQVRKLFYVSPTCFRPIPNVRSCVIRILFSHRDALVEEEKFVAFVKKAFGMRRKMLRHFVAHTYGKSAVLKISENVRSRRIETFPPEEIYHLFTTLNDND